MCLVLLGAFESPGQTPPSSVEFTTTNHRLKEGLTPFSSAYYRVSDFSWLTASLMAESYPAYFYPDTTTWHPGGYYALFLDSAVAGDFNSDGRDDLALQWVVFPHTLERSTLLSLDILINKGDNTFARSEAFTGAPLQIHMPYRIKRGHFNSDSTPDLVSGSMGIITRLPDGSYFNKNEPFPVLLSQADRRLLHAHTNVGEQTDTEPHPGFSFSHDLSVGDVNGDGYDDIYLGKMLFVNDTRGGFYDGSSALPRPISTQSRFYAMSSASADFNGDGFDDIAVFLSEGARPPGYVWLSDGHAFDALGWTLEQLPVGAYGADNTKFNDATTADIDGDGDIDLITAVTRANPYYEGSRVQLFENDGLGRFEDVTQNYITYSPSVDTIHGEGVLFAQDVNEDGRIDIHHALSEGGYRLYLNSGDHFVISRASVFPRIQPIDMTSWAQGLYSPSVDFHVKAFPVDIDGIPPVDYVTTTRLGDEIVFYSVIAQLPLRTLPPTGRISFDPSDTLTVVSPGGITLRWSRPMGSDFTEVEQSSDESFESNYQLFSSVQDSLAIVPEPGTDEVHLRLRSGNNLGTSEDSVTRVLRVRYTSNVQTNSLPLHVDDDFEVYPNPTRGSFRVRSSRVRSDLLLLDALGRVVLRRSQADLASLIDISSLGSGAYLLCLENSGERICRPILRLAR